jgi:antitoxin component YwqK of YwqJK toxin-antitoxin module
MKICHFKNGIENGPYLQIYRNGEVKVGSKSNGQDHGTQTTISGQGYKRVV